MTLGNRVSVWDLPASRILPVILGGRAGWQLWMWERLWDHGSMKGRPGLDNNITHEC